MIDIKQYNPVSTSETSAQDSFSVRSIYDIANGINAFKKNVPFILLNEVFADPLEKSTTSTTEQTDYILGTWEIPPGFNNIFARINHAKKSGSAANLIWGFYAANTLNNVNSPLSGSTPVSNGSVSESGDVATSSSTSYSSDLFNINIQDIIPANRIIHIYLSYKSDTGSTNAEAYLRSVLLCCGGVYENV